MAKGWSFDSLVKALKEGAFLDVGKTKGTIAAGDDSRIVNALQNGNNLSDVANAEVARTNLGVYASRGGLGKTNLDTLFADNAAGVWSQSTSANTVGNNYPIASAGALLILSNSVWAKGVSQVYYPYNSSGIFFIRTVYAHPSVVWSPWATYESSDVLRPLITTAQTAANNANTNANGRVPNTRKVNGKALSADINLTAGDVGAYSKGESDGKYQPKGNYADKSTSSLQKFNSPLEVTNEIQVSTNEIRLGLKTINGIPHLISKNKLGTWHTVSIPDKSGTLALMDDIEIANNIPVGSPIPWSLATPPSGYLICNGQTFDKSTYPKLAIAYPSGTLPDLRGEFIRGLDSGRGIDAGRSILSAQKGNSLLSSNIFGGLSSSESNKWHRAINYIGITGTNNDGNYGVYQQIEGANGNETRPRNIAFLYIVRAA